MASEAIFWSHVEKSETCWKWIAGIFKQTGYGQSWTGNYKPTTAHRVAWELTFGAIPEGLWVLHKCDNRLCVRPEHLFLGTASDNNWDMVRKGRHWKSWTMLKGRQCRNCLNSPNCRPLPSCPYPEHLERHLKSNEYSRLYQQKRRILKNN